MHEVSLWRRIRREFRNVPVQRIYRSVEGIGSKMR